MPVRDLQDGQDLDEVLLVRASELRRSRSGEPFLRLTLCDGTGTLQAAVFDEPERVAQLAPRGAAVRVAGRFERHPKWGPQVQLRELRPAEAHEVDAAALLDGPPRSAAAMEADLRELVATVQDRHLRRLLEAVFGPGTRTWEAFRRWPAAKHFHQAYEHGLLEHTLTVAQGVSTISATFPEIDRDVAVTGALLHDIGKLEAYTDDPSCIDLTDAGRLLGEIPLGYFFVRRMVEALDEEEPFPADRAQAVLHIVLSHHGTLEHGSPVVPQTREATLVHFLDNLGGRLGSFDRLEKALPAGAVWSPFDRAIGSGAYFGPPAAERTAAAAA
jgi:3'-5' exoribonuclease